VTIMIMRGGQCRDLRVEWLRGEALQAERDIHRLVGVLARRRVAVGALLDDWPPSETDVKQLRAETGRTT
jgi:hypothetical protein